MQAEIYEAIIDAIVRTRPVGKEYYRVWEEIMCEIAGNLEKVDEFFNYELFCNCCREKQC